MLRIYQCAGYMLEKRIWFVMLRLWFALGEASLKKVVALFGFFTIICFREKFACLPAGRDFQAANLENPDRIFV